MMHWLHTALQYQITLKDALAWYIGKAIFTTVDTVIKVWRREMPKIRQEERDRRARIAYDNRYK